MKIKSYLLLTRPVNVFITFITIAAAAVISIEGIYNLTDILLAAVSGALTAAAGNAVNDYFDTEIDKINRPDRILPSGRLSMKEAAVFIIVLIFASLVISAFISILSLFIVLFTIDLLIFYSYKLKTIPLLGNFIVALLTGLAFIYGGAAVENIEPVLLPAAFAFLINLIRELIKDMEDIDGDVKHGVITYPYKYGFNNTKKIILFLSLIFIIITLVPYFTGYYSLLYLLILLLIIFPVVIFINASLYKNEERANLSRLSGILKLTMLAGLAAVYLGR